MTAPVIVSDHALVRYLERVHGLDFEAEREEIRADINLQAAIAAGAKAHYSRGLLFILDGATVVTIVDKVSGG